MEGMASSSMEDKKGDPYSPPQKPADPEVLNNIDVLALFIARNGPEFEDMARARQANNPKFSFLFDSHLPDDSPDSVAREYFLWKKNALLMEKQREENKIASPKVGEKDAQEQLCGSKVNPCRSQSRQDSKVDEEDAQEPPFGSKANPSQSHMRQHLEVGEEDVQEQPYGSKANSMESKSRQHSEPIVPSDDEIEADHLHSSERKDKIMSIDYRSNKGIQRGYEEKESQIENRTGGFNDTGIRLNDQRSGWDDADKADTKEIFANPDDQGSQLREETRSGWDNHGVEMKEHHSVRDDQGSQLREEPRSGWGADGDGAEMKLDSKGSQLREHWSGWDDESSPARERRTGWDDKPTLDKAMEDDNKAEDLTAEGIPKVAHGRSPSGSRSRSCSPRGRDISRSSPRQGGWGDSHGRSPGWTESRPLPPGQETVWRGGRGGRGGQGRGEWEFQGRGGRGRGQHPCFDFIKGRCFRGNNCKFVHERSNPSGTQGRGWRDPDSHYESRWNNSLMDSASKGKSSTDVELRDATGNNVDRSLEFHNSGHLFQSQPYQPPCNTLPNLMPPPPSMNPMPPTVRPPHTGVPMHHFQPPPAPLPNNPSIGAAGQPLQREGFASEQWRPFHQAQGFPPIGGNLQQQPGFSIHYGALGQTTSSVGPRTMAEPPLQGNFPDPMMVQGGQSMPFNGAPRVGIPLFIPGSAGPPSAITMPQDQMPMSMNPPQGLDHGMSNTTTTNNNNPTVSTMPGYSVSGNPAISGIPQQTEPKAPPTNSQRIETMAGSKPELSSSSSLPAMPITQTKASNPINSAPNTLPSQVGAEKTAITAGGGGNDDATQIKQGQDLKLLKSAVAEYVKEVLKPTWKEGQISKEAFKTIAKKAVDKVAGALQGHQIPSSQEKLDQFMSLSRTKIAKLVQGYVEKYTKS